MAEKTAWPLLFITAAYQAYAGLSSVAYVFMGVLHPAGGLAAWTAAAAGALQAIAGVAAIVLGARGDLRGTVLAVAGGTMLGWLATLPSVAEQGLDFRGGERIASAYFVLAPVIAIAAAALAWRRLFPVAAALIVTAPTLVGLLFIAALAAVIAIHGI